MQLQDYIGINCIEGSKAFISIVIAVLLVSNNAVSSSSIQ